MLSQLRETDLPVGDASRTLRSSSGLLELLPIYQPFVEYMGSKGSKLEFNSPSTTVHSQYAIAKRMLNVVHTAEIVWMPVL